jgi:hypothetical protein
MDDTLWYNGRKTNMFVGKWGPNLIEVIYQLKTGTALKKVIAELG